MKTKGPKEGKAISKAARALINRLNSNVKTRVPSNYPPNFLKETAITVSQTVLSYVEKHIDILSQTSTVMQPNLFKEQNMTKVQSILKKFEKEVSTYCPNKKAFSKCAKKQQSYKKNSM